MRLLTVEHPIGGWPPIRQSESLVGSARNRGEFLKMTSIDLLRAQILSAKWEPLGAPNLEVPTYNHQKEEIR